MTVGSGTTKLAYGESSYWDDRYSQHPGSFDWYQKYPALAPLLDLYIRRHHRILLIGCGNSALGEDMIGDGYQDVVNIDSSSVVIEAMQKKYQDRPEFKYIKMDVLDMSVFESGSFDAVIDKGTLDSLLCGHNAQQNATKMLDEVVRVLKDRGIYILITYGAPNFRLSLLREPCLWTIKLHVIDKLGSETRSHPTWELTDPIPLNEDGSSVTRVVGGNPDVHYIYVCIKFWKEKNPSSSSRLPSPFPATSQPSTCNQACSLPSAIASALQPLAVTIGHRHSHHQHNSRPAADLSNRHQPSAIAIASSSLDDSLRNQ